MSHSENNKEFKVEKQASYALRVTIITLLGYGCGLMFTSKMLLGAVMMAILMLAIFISNKKPDMFYQSTLMLLKFIITTFTFGIIHSFTF